ncbi:MAG: hypothetical protein R3C18_12320 [Planctomycetaceae bacterium]
MSFLRACGYLLLLGSMAQFGDVANAQTPHPAKQAGPEAQKDPAQTPPSFDPAQRSGSNIESPSAGDGHAVNSASDLPLIPLCPPVPLVSSAMFAPRNEFTLGVTPAVPIHEREAEIWFKLPEHALLTVNFREYSEVGTFCIVKTKIPTREPRRYYFSARYATAHGGKPLHPSISMSDGMSGINTLGQDYVDLFPGSHAEICFVSDCESTEGYTVPVKDCCEELKQAIKELQGEVASQKKTVGDNSKALEANSTRLKELTEEMKNLRDAIEKQQKTFTVAQAEAAEDLARAFQFRTTEITLKEVGTTSPNDFRGLPGSVVLSTQDVPVKLGNLRVVEATLTLTVRRSSSPNDPHIGVLAQGVPIQLVNHTTSFSGTILLSDLVHASLNDYLNSERAAGGTRTDYQIDGTLKLQGVEASPLTGEIGNHIRLRLTK